MNYISILYQFTWAIFHIHISFCVTSCVQFWAAILKKFYASVREHYLHWRLDEKVQLQGIILIYTQSIIYVLNPEKVCIGIQINELYPIYTRSDFYRVIFLLLWALLLWYIGLKMKIISKKGKKYTTIRSSFKYTFVLHFFKKYS